MMYWGSGGNPAWWMWIPMTVSMLLFWGLVVWGVVTVVRHVGGGRRDAKAILDERFARGEVSEEEYRRRLDLLQGGPFTGGPDQASSP